MTNAHVVAGQDDTTVAARRRGRPPRRAQAVAFDPRNDVAVLRVDGLGGRPLPLAEDPEPGSQAAILGFPENGPYDVRAGRIGATRTVLTQDAYGRGPVRRRLTTFRGLRAPGQLRRAARRRPRAGAHDGVRGHARRPRGGFGVPNSIVAEDLRSPPVRSSTGPCAR